jgi:prepilin-type N-terminal cleavage/methylation domain-containing protein
LGRRDGVTLIELVVVLLILGILAAIALPRFFGTTGAAADSALGRTLHVVREAIEMHAAHNAGRLPGGDGSESTFKKDLKPYLTGEFPTCPVGKKDARVTLVDVAPDAALTPDGSTGWMFNTRDGRFIANSNDKSNDGSRTHDQF